MTKKRYLKVKRAIEREFRLADKYETVLPKGKRTPPKPQTQWNWMFSRPPTIKWEQNTIELLDNTLKEIRRMGERFNKVVAGLKCPTYPTWDFPAFDLSGIPYIPIPKYPEPVCMWRDTPNLMYRKLRPNEIALLEMKQGQLRTRYSIGFDVAKEPDRGVSFVVDSNGVVTDVRKEVGK